MTVDELYKAKENGELVKSPNGNGKVNGIGNKFTYIYFQFSPDSVEGQIIEFENQTLTKVTD